MLETAIAIGHMPVAACELIRFRADAIQPELPPDVTDLGLRGAPNFELLQLTRPDLILTSPYYTRYQDRLEALAPVLSSPFYTPGEPPCPRRWRRWTSWPPRSMTRRPAAAHKRPPPPIWPAARPNWPPTPICPISGQYRRCPQHLRAFDFDSLFGSTLPLLGLQNAWSGGTRFSFMAPVPIRGTGRLARCPSGHHRRRPARGAAQPVAQHPVAGPAPGRQGPALPTARGERLWRHPLGAWFAGLLAQTLAAGPVVAL